MANRSFQLRRSRLAFVFQLIVFTLLILLLQQLLSPWLWALCLLLAVIGYAYGLKVPQPICFEHLDAREWSLSRAQSEQIQRVSVSHIIDHQLYIVVYFQHARAKPIIVWCDQMPFRQWKSFKVLAKMI